VVRGVQSQALQVELTPAAKANIFSVPDCELSVLLTDCCAKTPIYPESCYMKNLLSGVATSVLISVSAMAAETDPVTAGMAATADAAARADAARAQIESVQSGIDAVAHPANTAKSAIKDQLPADVVKAQENIEQVQKVVEKVEDVRNKASNAKETAKTAVKETVKDKLGVDTDVITKPLDSVKDSVANARDKAAAAVTSTVNNKVNGAVNEAVGNTANTQLEAGQTAVTDSAKAVVTDTAPAATAGTVNAARTAATAAKTSANATAGQAGTVKESWKFWQK
jgi:hypothetical protein